jgi:hypothetical protein
VISRHNKIRDELSDLAFKALIPSAVCDKPKIYPSCPAKSMSALDDPPNGTVTRNFHKNQGKDQGDILIRGLWAHGTNCIIDVRDAGIINCYGSTWAVRPPRTHKELKQESDPK